jgi:serralysin
MAGTFRYTLRDNYSGAGDGDIYGGVNTTYESIAGTPIGAGIIASSEYIFFTFGGGLNPGYTADLTPLLASSGGYYFDVSDFLSGVTLAGGNFGDILTGGIGIDTLLGNGGNDALRGNYGNDVLIGEAGNDQLYGGHDLDRLYGDEGNDILDGGAGNDRLDGGAGNDKLYVDSAGDTVVEGLSGGIDTIYLGTSYTLKAGVAVEVLSAGSSAAGLSINLVGNEFAQNIIGNSSNNHLKGLGGNDDLQAGKGKDYLYGGVGKDALTGGLGNDFFVFDTTLNASTNVDTIRDFHNIVSNSAAIADNDTLMLDDRIFAKLNTGTLYSTFFKANATGTATDANDHIVYNTTSGKLYYDINGNAAGGAIQFATLTDHPTLTASDFLIY